MSDPRLLLPIGSPLLEPLEARLLLGGGWGGDGPVPEVLVKGNGIEIVCGDSTPDLADGTDFGSVEQGQPGPIGIFTVRNTGDAILTLGGVTLPSGFVVTEGLSSSLGPGSSDTFTVRLESASVGVSSGEISFSNNDSDENPFNFQITGTVTPPPAPEIAVEFNGQDITDGDATPAAADGTDFGGVLQYRIGPSRTFTVRNTGNATLTLGNVTVPSGFVVTEGLSGALPPGGADTFTVGLLAAAAGSFGGDIGFATNDGDENPFNFRIAGSVTAAAPTHLVALTDGAYGESLGGFSADGATIAYSQFWQATWDSSDIWVMNSDGSGKHQVTSGYGAFNPVFLPDGRISYVRENGSDDFDIWIINADGSAPGELLGGPLKQGEHSWNRSGKKIAYADQYAPGGGSEIWTANADGTRKVRLTDHRFDGFSQSCPVYSRRGSYIAYMNQTDGGSDAHVWIMRSNGRSKRQVTFGPGGETPVFWWPDDSAIGFIRKGAAGSSELWVLHLATGAVTPLIALPDGEICSADLSRTGSELVVEVSDATGTHIWSFDARVFGGKLKAQWSDHDADAVVLSLAKPGIGAAFDTAKGIAPSITVWGTAQSSRLSIKVTRNLLGDGQVAIGDLAVQDGSLKVLSAGKVALAGDIFVSGPVGAIILGDVAEGAITIEGIDAYGVSMGSLQAGRVTDLEILVPGGIKSVSVADWQEGAITAGWVGAIRTKAGAKTGSLGRFGADLTLTGSAMPAGKPVLGSARIAGDLLPGVIWDIQTGAVGRIAVTGTADHSVLRTSGDVASISLGASSGSDFGAGVTLDLLKSSRHANPGDPANVPTGVIRSFSIKGLKTPTGQPKPRFFIDSNISVGGGTVNILNWDGLGGLFAPTGSALSVNLKETEPGFAYTSDDFVHLV